MVEHKFIIDKAEQQGERGDTFIHVT